MANVLILIVLLLILKEPFATAKMHILITAQILKPKVMATTQNLTLNI